MFNEWLRRTLLLQRVAYGIDPPELVGPARAEYTRWNVLAAIDELTEFLNETQWKPWAEGQGEINDRDAAMEELVDTLHFVGNLLCMLSVTDEELDVIYAKKMLVNAQRQESGTYRG